MEEPPGKTPGLRIPLKQDSDGYRLAFGLDGKRLEALTEAQLMTLVIEGAKALGLAISAQPRASS
jgi:hypothetical protein